MIEDRLPILVVSKEESFDSLMVDTISLYNRMCAVLEGTYKKDEYVIDCNIYRLNHDLNHFETMINLSRINDYTKRHSGIYYRGGK